MQLASNSIAAGCHLILSHASSNDILSVISYISRFQDEFEIRQKHERAQRVSKILFLTREDKSHIFKPPCNVLGPVVQRWVSANPGLKFNLLF
jgi:hypothetical protein